MKIILGELKEKRDELIAFLEPRVGTKFTVESDTLQSGEKDMREGVKPRQVKTYIKRFLHKNDLRSSFRVLVKGTELTVQKLEKGAEEEKEEGEKEAKRETQVEKKEEPKEEEKAETPAKAEKVEREAGEPPKEKKAKPKAKKAKAKKEA